MKQVFRTCCAIVALLLVGAFGSAVYAQAASATPDGFVTQLTSSPTSAFSSFAGDASANGRFVVIESNGDLATQNRTARNNADGNREIFLIDYAQRRIFQITDTKGIPNPTPTPSPTPSPSPSPSPSPGASPTPTPTPVPTPEDPTTLKIEISNNRPMISLQPQLIGGKRVYVIVFSSNAPMDSHGTFDGTDSSALDADANQEVWIYEIPAVADVDLTTGADLPLIDLSAGTFTRITNTTASRAPTPGTLSTTAPFVADDNREATISDDGKIIAFISTRANDLLTNGDNTASPEIYLFNRMTAGLTQVTNTHDEFNSNNILIFSAFNSNPCLSSDGSVLAFLSNGNLTANNDDDGKGHGNGEIYVANYSGSTVSNLHQVTKTKNDATQATVNIFSPGRRLSRDGSMLAFESLADDPKANVNTSNKPFLAVFVYVLGTDAFTLIGPRPTGSTDIIHFPAFTDYNAALKPSTVVFSSALNFKPDGTFPTTATDGLNPNNLPQFFSAPLPFATTSTFARLTGTAFVASFGTTRALTTDSIRRIAFSLGGAELGSGNSDFSTEVFYLLLPPDNVESPAPLSFFTGASNQAVPTATPTPNPSATPTPTPSPSPSPSPSPNVTPSPTPEVPVGLAAGELSIIRSTVDLAPADAGPVPGSETGRRPALPVELNGVSVSVAGAAAGLYFVGGPSRQINFVVPIGLVGITNPVPVIVNNNGTVLRGLINVVTDQPDIFTSTMDALGRARVFNVTNPLNRSMEPFSVTSDDGSGTQVPTILEIDLTGVRNVAASGITVTIGTTDITPAILVSPNLEMPGFDIVTITLPATLAGAGDVPIIVKATNSSRSADTAAHITISP